VGERGILAAGNVFAGEEGHANIRRHPWAIKGLGIFRHASLISNRNSHPLGSLGHRTCPGRPGRTNSPWHIITSTSGASRSDQWCRGSSGAWGFISTPRRWGIGEVSVEGWAGGSMSGRARSLLTAPNDASNHRICPALRRAGSRVFQIPRPGMHLKTRSKRSLPRVDWSARATVPAHADRLWACCSR